MSRSNPVEAGRNPCTRWFEWAGGKEGGFVKYYDKAQEKSIKAGDTFQFILLDELATVKGWHDASDSSIFANEVRDTRQDVLVVRSFKGGELASGHYTAIRDRVGNMGGHFHASCYIAYKDDGGNLALGNLGFKGAALGAWMDFKKECPARKDANGKSIRGYYAEAVKITGFTDMKKGATDYRVPRFALTPITPESNQSAIALDMELQTFMADYLKRPTIEQTKAVAQAPAQAAPAETAPDDDGPPPGRGPDGFEDEDIPF